MTHSEIEKMARCLKMLGHPTRLKILNSLRDGPQNVQELTQLLKTRQANLSQHLSLMQDRGLLSSHRQGNFIYYAVARPSMFEVLDTMERLYCRELHPDAK